MLESEMTNTQPKFATFEKFEKGGQWKPTDFEDLVPGDAMRSSNSPGKTFKVESMPSPLTNQSGNWAVRVIRLTAAELRERGITEKDMTLREAMVASLLTEHHENIGKDKCLWVAEFDSDNVWIHTESLDGLLASYKVPLSVFKRHLADK